LIVNYFKLLIQIPCTK